MKGLATSKLRSFKEAALGHGRVFGNIAVAVASAKSRRMRRKLLEALK